MERPRKKTKNVETVPHEASSRIDDWKCDFNIQLNIWLVCDSMKKVPQIVLPLAHR